jgi:predicted DNA-binding protein with PD1-like motif
MQSQEKENLIIARFFPGENVFEQLKEVCLKYNLKTGVVISGIGQLVSFELGFFKEKGNYMNQKFESPFEMLSLNGLVSLNNNGGYDFHLHSTLSGSEKNTVGGHFIDGVVSVTLELAILKSEITINRKIEEETGLNGLILDF